MSVHKPFDTVKSSIAISDLLEPPLDALKIIYVTKGNYYLNHIMIKGPGAKFKYIFSSTTTKKESKATYSLAKNQHYVS